MGHDYGLYSNAHRGKLHKAVAEPSHPPLIEDDPVDVSSKGWAGMIRKVYEGYPLSFPPCGGRMRLITHLELTFEANRIRLGRAASASYCSAASPDSG